MQEVTVDVRVLGADELGRKFSSLEEKMQRQYLRRALRAGAKVILGAAKENAPKRTGALARSLQVRSARSRPPYVRYTVVTGERLFGGETFYGAFQEFGWKTGRRYSRRHSRDQSAKPRRQIPGKHFLERAATLNVSEVIEAIRGSLAADIAANESGV